MFKIYVKNNYFFIKDHNSLYEGLKKDVRVNISNDDLANPSVSFSNVKGWNNAKTIRFNQIVDENNDPFSDVDAFIDFYTQNTGNFNGGGAAPLFVTNTEMLAIPSPSLGQQVFNTTENGYYYYNGTEWKQIGSDVPVTSSQITVVDNYSSLPDPTTVPEYFYWASNSQGTKWLPGSLGGTYYNKGLYFSNGVSWEYMETPYQATQAEVNTGTNNDKFLTPLTFENANKWSAYIPFLGVTVSGRKMKFGFLPTGLKISSRSDGSEIGVVLTTDDLTADRARNEQDKDGTYALVEDGYIPLAGTEVGNPVTGNIEFQDYTGKIINVNSGSNSNFNTYIFADDGNFFIQTEDDATGYYYRLGLGGDQTTAIVIDGTNPNFKGFLGNAYYGANYDEFTYVQKKWVDDNFSKYLLRVIEPTSPVTGTTAETVLYTWFVRANTFSTLDRFMINEFTVVSNGTLLANATLRIRFNTTSTVDTSTNNKVFATAVLNSGSGNRYASLERAVDFIDTKIKGFFNLAGSFTDKGSSVYTENNFDTTVDNWFFFTVQNGNVADSTYMKNIIITR